MPYILFINSCYKNISDVKRNPNNKFGGIFLLIYEFIMTMLKILIFNKITQNKWIPNSTYFNIIFAVFLIMVFCATYKNITFFKTIYNNSIIRTWIIAGIYLSKVKFITAPLMI